MRRPGTSVPISVTSILVTLALALTVGWQILVAREFRALVEGFTLVHWVLVVLGSLFFCAIITASILLTAWLVREIRTNQRQQAFLDAVTHELRTPLASLQLAIDTLENPALGIEQRREFLDILRAETHRLEATVGHILQAARSDPRRTARNPVDLVALLHECAEDAIRRHGLKTEQIQLAAPGQAAVRGDAEQLRVVFRNLLDNAIRHAGAPSRIEVRVEATGERKLEVTVTDHGVGIPRRALRRIFLPFQQLEAEGTAPKRGLGLGLSIVHNIVRDHGGSVRARSEGMGKGSRFVVRLPGSVA